MARYMKVAADAPAVVDNIMNLVGRDNPMSAEILSDILYLYNLGIRTAPRAVQSTVRLNAVREAGKNQRCTIRMVEKPSGNPRYPTYKAIQISVVPSLPGEVPVREDGDADEE